MHQPVPPLQRPDAKDGARPSNTQFRTVNLTTRMCDRHTNRGQRKAEKCANYAANTGSCSCHGMHHFLFAKAFSTRPCDEADHLPKVSCLTNHHTRIRHELVGRHLEVQRCRSAANTSGDVVLRAMTRTEPAVIVAMCCR